MKARNNRITVTSDGKVCFYDVRYHGIIESPDKSPVSPYRWELDVRVVDSIAYKRGDFPIREEFFIIGNGTKKQMEALWDSICKQNTSSEPEPE